MPRLPRFELLGVGLALLATACSSAPPGTPPQGSVGVLPADARALQYGSSVTEIFNSPSMGEKVQEMFGKDWLPGSQSGGALRYGAAAYFPANSSLRMLRMDGREYVAIMGCVQEACATHRGLILLPVDGDEMWARIDEGGYSRYYGRGPAMTNGLVRPAFIDSAWRAVERIDRA